MATPCVAWPKTRNRAGYGVVGYRPRGQSRLAHRHAWEAIYGRVPDGLQVLHCCDNPPCVNVDHLFLGTPKTNSDDKIAKGRLRYGLPAHLNRGEHQGSHKLTTEQVLAIRRDARSQRYIAVDYGICQQTVSQIKRRESWAWLQPQT